MMKTLSSVAAALALVSAAAIARAGTVIADGTGIAFMNPHACNDGSVVVMERTLHVPAGLECLSAYSDVYLYRLDAGCGRKLLTRFTNDGMSLDGCPSADGSRVAWRTFDGTTNRVFIADVDGTNGSELFAAPGDMSDLELAPNGDVVAFKVYGRTTPAQAEIIRVLVSNPGVADVVDVAPTVGDMTLNTHRCIDVLGRVLYSKSVGGPHDLFIDEPGPAPPENAIAPTPEDERFFSTDTGPAVQHTCVFVGRSMTGVDNLYSFIFKGTVHALTFNTDPSWSIGRATVGGTGGHAAFTSKGNHVGSNSDGSLELFTVGISTDGHPTVTRQWTDYVPPQPPPGTGAVWAQIFAGFDVKDDHLLDPLPRDQTVFSAATSVNIAVACNAAALNTFDIELFTGMESTPVFQPIASLDTLPSFESVSATCNQVPAEEEVRCTLVLRTTEEGPRQFLVFGTTGNYQCVGPPLLRRSPVALTVPASTQATFNVSYRDCDFPPATVVFDILSPDAGQTDVARMETSY